MWHSWHWDLFVAETATMTLAIRVVIKQPWSKTAVITAAVIMAAVATAIAGLLY
jgi:hypothetical protein